MKPLDDPLPEHSSVIKTSLRGRAFRSSSVKLRGVSTCPADLQSIRVIIEFGNAIVLDAEDLILRRQPFLECFPIEPIGWRARHVQKRNELIVRFVREQSTLRQRHPREQGRGRTGLQDRTTIELGRHSRVPRDACRCDE